MSLLQTGGAKNSLFVSIHLLIFTGSTACVAASCALVVLDMLGIGSEERRRGGEEKAKKRDAETCAVQCLCCCCLRDDESDATFPFGKMEIVYVCVS